MDEPAIEELGAAALIDRLRRRELSAEQVVRACLERIARDEPRVQAWAHLDAERALAAARALDAGPPRPPLFGLPVGVKDIIDTADAPTECGTAIYRGRRPVRDAACVATLRGAGAVILGKTVTTELAYFQPGPTRNPLNPAHTPGGSSSGSAAAVAACMVPAALGTQTAGSIIRPAAFCGIVGFKPSHGLLSMEGIHPFAPSLDTLGLLVRAVEDVAPLLAALGAPLEVPRRSGAPRIGLWRTAQWSRATSAMQERLEAVATELGRAGASVREVTLGPEELALSEAQALVMASEAVESYGALLGSGGPGPGAHVREILARGGSIPANELREARARAGRAREAAAAALAEVDVLLTPSAPGEAPEGLGSTGDPVFNRVPTLLGLPCLSLPAGVGPSGLPLGVQLVGAPRGEGMLIGVAGWVESRLAPAVGG